MRQGGEQTGPYRDAVRWGLLLAAVAATGFRLRGIVHNFREWRAALPIDPSAADLYRTNFWIEVIAASVVLALGVGLFYLLKPRGKDPG